MRVELGRDASDDILDVLVRDLGPCPDRDEGPVPFRLGLRGTGHEAAHDLVHGGGQAAPKVAAPEAYVDLGAVQDVPQAA